MPWSAANAGALFALVMCSRCGESGADVGAKQASRGFPVKSVAPILQHIPHRCLWHQFFLEIHLDHRPSNIHLIVVCGRGQQNKLDGTLTIIEPIRIGDEILEFGLHLLKNGQAEAIVYSDNQGT